MFAGQHSVQVKRLTSELLCRLSYPGGGMGGPAFLHVHGNVGRCTSLRTPRERTMPEITEPDRSRLLCRGDPSCRDGDACRCDSTGHSSRNWDGPQASTVETPTLLEHPFDSRWRTRQRADREEVTSSRRERRPLRRVEGARCPTPGRHTRGSRTALSRWRRSGRPRRRPVGRMTPRGTQTRSRRARTD